jgi:hypothetical protein
MAQVGALGSVTDTWSRGTVVVLVTVIAQLAVDPGETAS